MKAFTILALILLILILTFVLPNTINEYKLSRSRESVTVKILQLPNCNIGYKHKFIHIAYNDKKYILRTSCKYVKSLVKGQELIMLHKAGTEIFLFENEDATSELLSIIALVFLLLICAGKFIRNDFKQL